jgi:hypothetical protein
MIKMQNLPNPERLSIVMATILLAYALTKFVNVPSKVISINFIGIFIPITINFNSIVTVSVAGMTASGADWLYREHPTLGRKSTTPHLLLPGITAWILSIVLTRLPNSPLWWVIFSTGGAFLLLVILAEYIALDDENIRHHLAMAMLNALSYAIFLALAVALRSSGLRLIMILPAVAIATGALSLRIIHLYNPVQWYFYHSFACLIILSQLATALHYLPVSPLSFGLFLLGALYATINFISNIINERLIRIVVFESISAMAVLWIIGLWLN